MNIAIVLAGGIGSRMDLKDYPKQYIMVGDKPIIGYCLETFQRHKNVDGIYIVADQAWHDYILKWMGENDIKKFCGFAEPGKTRQFSIFHALLEAEKRYQAADKIIIHDAARPFVTEAMITEGLQELENADGVMPVLPAKDTFYRSSDGRSIAALLSREELFAGQAPEFFYLGKYLSIHRQMSQEEILKINGSSEIAYKNGCKISIIKGDEKNFKVTTPNDIELMKLYLENR